MEKPQQSIEEQLIRYRIEKRMAGQRDLLLHGAVYIAVALIVLLNQPILVNMRNLPILGGFWTLPLILHGLRYYYRCGPGASRRADEIERAIDDQLGRTALDEDEEVLIEERVSKRIRARRLVVAHGLASVAILAMYLPHVLLEPVTGPWTAVHIQQTLTLFGLAFALHFSRFFFVHGRTQSGRALKIDAAVESEWHRSRERGLARRELYEQENDSVSIDLGEVRGRRLRLTDEGELDATTLEVAEDSDGQGHAR